MNVKLLDTDTREGVCIVDCPQSPENVAGVMDFVSNMTAPIVRTVPHEGTGERAMELEISVGVCRSYTSLPGDSVHFMVRHGSQRYRINGVYQFKRRYSYIVLDDGGGEWKLQSMWEIKRHGFFCFPNTEKTVFKNSISHRHPGQTKMPMTADLTLFISDCPIDDPIPISLLPNVLHCSYRKQSTVISLSIDWIFAHA